MRVPERVRAGEEGVGGVLEQRLAVESLKDIGYKFSFMRFCSHREGGGGSFLHFRACVQRRKKMKKLGEEVWRMTEFSNQFHSEH